MTTLRKMAMRLSLAALAGLAVAAAALYALDALFPFPLHRIGDRLATGSIYLRAADKSLVSWRVDADENRRLYVPLSDIAPALAEAAIAVEDKRFRRHCGVDPVAIGRAALQNLTAGRRVSGASTITMQTVRLLWPRPRTLGVKLAEAFRAWQLERLAGKDRILEIYLNLAPYGGNVVGAEAASRRYFGKPARQLTLAEACLLAGLPQSPARLNPLRYPGAALRRRNFVALRMLEDGVIDSARAEAVWREGLEITRARPSVEAPHFAQFVLDRVRRTGDLPAALDATLDPDCQALVAKLSAPRAAELTAKGVSGPAVVVLAARDSSILAYLGNASPEGAPARLVDGALAMRQPGSLMKPFIFALLADRKGIAPSTRVYDLPAVWADYRPRNMDREYLGGMTAAEALRQSRNVTAVRQLEALGVEPLNRFLEGVGLERGAPGRHGLALALGAKEQNLLGLANAYAALARLGLWLPPRFAAERPLAVAKRVLRPEVAWLTLSALAPAEESERPSLVWKTGTSWNQLDAWAIAATPDHVVGVWCGRLARGGSEWVAGAEDALPLALDIVEALPGRSAGHWPRPEGVEMRRVCSGSGAPAGWNCPETALSPMLSGALAQCRLHRSPPAGREERRPAELAGAGGGPRILSPTPDATYVRLPGEDSSLTLLAESEAGGALTWFLDGKLLGETGSGQVLEWAMLPGKHRLSVADARGGTALLDMTVADYDRE